MGAGYKTLEFVLIDLHKGKPSRDLLLSLLDMLVDGSFQPSNMVIQVDILKQCILEFRYSAPFLVFNIEELKNLR